MPTNISISSVSPRRSIPGGELLLEILGLHADDSLRAEFLIDEQNCFATAVSTKRAVISVPELEEGGRSHLALSINGVRSNTLPIVVGRKLLDGLHMVANPAVDPFDGSLMVTISGSRGQQLSETLFRIETDGTVYPFPEAVMNPTGIAFDRNGRMFVSARATGEILCFSENGSYTVHASNLGIPTGIAFGRDDHLYVGDRTGTIHRVSPDGEVTNFATLDPSVAAYHLAIGPEGRLYVTTPGFGGRDLIYRIDVDGSVSEFVKGLGRPQGLAFGGDGLLYVAASCGGRRGVVSVTSTGETELAVAGDGIIGLCFAPTGSMIVATSDAVYSVDR